MKAIPDKFPDLKKVVGYIFEYRQNKKVSDFKDFKKLISQISQVDGLEHNYEKEDIKRLYHIACSHVNAIMHIKGILEKNEYL